MGTPTPVWYYGYEENQCETASAVFHRMSDTRGPIPLPHPTFYPQKAGNTLVTLLVLRVHGGYWSFTFRRYFCWFARYFIKKLSYRYTVLLTIYWKRNGIVEN